MASFPVVKVGLELDDEGACLEIKNESRTMASRSASRASWTEQSGES